MWLSYTPSTSQRIPRDVKRWFLLRKFSPFLATAILPCSLPIPELNSLKVYLLQLPTFLYESIYRCHQINSGLSNEGISSPLREKDNCIDSRETMVGKAGNGDVDARGYALSRKRPGVP